MFLSWISRGGYSLCICTKVHLYCFFFCVCVCCTCNHAGKMPNESRPCQQRRGVAPLPNPTREFHFSSPQTDEGLQTEPFFIILLVFSIFTPPTAKTWDMMHIFNFSKNLCSPNLGSGLPYSHRGTYIITTEV